MVEEEGGNLLQEEVIIILHSFQKLSFLDVRTAILQALLRDVSVDIAAPDRVSGVADSVELELQGFIEDAAHLETEVVVVKCLQAFLET